MSGRSFRLQEVLHYNAYPNAAKSVATNHPFQQWLQLKLQLCLFASIRLSTTSVNLVFCSGTLCFFQVLLSRRHSGVDVAASLEPTAAAAAVRSRASFEVSTTMCLHSSPEVPDGSHTRSKPVVVETSEVYALSTAHSICSSIRCDNMIQRGSDSSE